MKFGVFYQMPCAADQSPAQRYQDTIGQVQLADELGFDAAWLAELHFNQRFSMMPSPMVVGAAMAQTTSRIRIGTAVHLVPLHQPIRLAEEAAALDVLSGGRSIFGIGRGAIPAHFLGYGVDQDRRPGTIHGRAGNGAWECGPSDDLPAIGASTSMLRGSTSRPGPFRSPILRSTSHPTAPTPST